MPHCNLRTSVALWQWLVLLLLWLLWQSPSLEWCYPVWEDAQVSYIVHHLINHQNDCSILLFQSSVECGCTFNAILNKCVLPYSCRHPFTTVPGSIQLNVVLLSIMLPFAECILYLSTTGETNRCFHRIDVILTVITWILGLTGLAWWIALGVFGSNPPSGGTITI